MKKQKCACVLSALHGLQLKSRVKEVLSTEMEKIKSEVRVDPTVPSS